MKITVADGAFVDAVGINKIYALIDPRDGEIRYIGKTRQTLRQRGFQHIRDAHERSISDYECYRKRWIRLLTRLGLELEIALVQVVGDDWQAAEIYWIHYFKKTGCRLTNSLLGGDGPDRIVEESRAKRSAAARGRVQSRKSVRNGALKKAKRYRIVSPDGKVFTPDLISEFCEENDLSLGGLRGLSKMNGKPAFKGRHKGWSCEVITDPMEGRRSSGKYERTQELRRRMVEDNPNIKFYEVTSPSGDKFIIKGMNNFCRAMNLSASNMVQTALRDRSSHMGWVAKQLSSDTPAEDLTPITDELVVRFRGQVIGYQATAPDGKIYTFDNMTLFCKEHSLGQTAMSAIARGAREAPYKGWTAKITIVQRSKDDAA